MQDVRNLLIWQRAHQLALETYRVTNDFPRDEVFGLRNMMRKVSVDIPAYIAEGAANRVMLSLRGRSARRLISQID